MTKMRKMVTMMMVILAAMLLMVAPVQAASKTTKVTLKQGQSKTLRVKTSSKVKWSSSNKAIVSVNSRGKIVARRPGKVKITAKYGKKKTVFVVTVKKPSTKKTFTIADQNWWPFPSITSSIRWEYENVYRIDRTEHAADGTVSSSSYYYYSKGKTW